MALQNFSFVKPEIAGSDSPYETSDLMEFVNSGISHVIVLTPELTLAEKLIPDMNIPLELIHYPTFGLPSKEVLDDFVKKVNQLKQRNKKAVVHCQFGQERTGIFLAYYLCKSYGLPMDEAINLVQKTRPSSLRSKNSIDLLKSICP